MSSSKSTTISLIAGGVAGGFEATVMYPTEFVKTQLQLYPGKYKGPIDCGVSIVKEKGFGSLYRGLSTLIVGSTPKAAVRFAAFNIFSKKLQDEKGKLSTINSMLAGLGAGVIEALVAVTPMETVKTKFIHDANSPNPKYKGLVHGSKLIFKEEGIRGFYKGIFPTVLKQGGNQAVRFTVFEKTKFFVFPEKKVLSAPENFFCGGVAGTVSVYATMPFDVVKTKMQGLKASEYKNSLDCLLKIGRNDGILALWKGATPRLGRVFFSSSIIFTVVGEVTKILNLIWPDK